MRRTKFATKQSNSAVITARRPRFWKAWILTIRSSKIRQTISSTAWRSPCNPAHLQPRYRRQNNVTKPPVEHQQPSESNTEKHTLAMNRDHPNHQHQPPDLRRDEHPTYAQH